MLKTTCGVFELYKSKWDSMKVLGTSIPLYLEKVKKVDDALLESEKDVKSGALDKRQSRKRLEERTFIFASGLLSIGKSENNPQIISVTSFPESSLSNMMEGKLITTSKNVLALAKANAEKLVNYGIVEADITDLDNEIKKFATVQTLPRTLVVDRKAAKLSLDDAVAQAKEMLTDQIDLQMEVLRKREPDFYNAFLAARKVVDTGIRHKKKEDAKPDTKPTTDTKPKSDATK